MEDLPGKAFGRVFVWVYGEFYATDDFESEYPDWKRYESHEIPWDLLFQRRYWEPDTRTP